MPTKERFAVTAEIISDITSSLVLDDVLQSVARRTAEVLDLWECDIYDYRAGENRRPAWPCGRARPTPTTASGSAPRRARPAAFLRARAARAPHDRELRRRSRPARDRPPPHGVLGRKDLPARAACLQRRGHRLPRVGREALRAPLQLPRSAPWPAPWPPWRPWPSRTRASTATSSTWPSPTASPASTTTATSTTAWRKTWPAPSATACRSRCS